MKKLVFLLLLFSDSISFGQQKAILDNGTKIVVYPNKTWKYENEENRDLKVESDSNRIFANLDDYNTVYEEPSSSSVVIKNYEQKGLEVLDFYDNFFLVCASDGKTGFVNELDIDNFSEIRDKVVKKISQKAYKDGKNLVIRNTKVEEINSASGVDFSIEWIYSNPNKIIKYIYFTVVPYNKVGDIQICNITGRATFTGKVTGPISSSDPLQKPYWSTAWYNNTISYVKLTKVEVEYLDGSKFVYIKDLPKILDKNFKNICE